MRAQLHATSSSSGVVASYRSGAVVSADGTEIAYREYGRGPSVVLVHGGAAAAQAFGELAAALASRFTVYVPDRRGRGRSGPFGVQHGLTTECADLEALLRRTHARAVFGAGTGAVIALYTASQLACVDKLALYEPPQIIPGARPLGWLARCERALERGDLAAAQIAMLEGTADIDSRVPFAPRFVVKALAALALRIEAASIDHIPARELLPTLREDARLIREASILFERFASLSCDVLLLRGSRSAPELHAGAMSLARLLRRPLRVVLDGVGHAGPRNDGQPDVVARALEVFFTMSTDSGERRT